MTRPAFLFLVALAGIGLVGIGLAYRSTGPDRLGGHRAPGAVSSEQTLSAPSSAATPATIRRDTEPKLVRSRPCLSDEELAAHPLIAGEVSRLDAVRLDSADIETYAGIPERDVKALADAGVSAAMAIYGARLALKADGYDPDGAVNVLLTLGPITEFKPASGERREALLEAADWFYAAALHGRSFALQRYGELLMMTGVDLVQAGILTEQEMAAIGKDERRRYSVSGFFSVAAFEVQPDIKQGVGKVLYDIARPLWPERAAMARFVERFEREQAERGVVGGRLPASGFHRQTLLDILCDDQLERLE